MHLRYLKDALILWWFYLHNQQLIFSGDITINCSKNSITKSETVTEISSDASRFGWGAVCNSICNGGSFNLDEIE